jgi:hypothetical protein
MLNRRVGWRAGRNPLRPSFAFGAASGALAPGMTFSRASGATYIDGSGSLVQVGANVPRYQGGGLLIERVPATNSFPNPRFEGAVAGSPGTLPTGVGFVGGTTLTRTILGVGVEDGFPYIDVRFTGTPATGGQILFFIVPVGFGIAGSVGQTWSVRLHARQIGGSPANIATPRLSVQEYNGGSYVTESNTAFPITTTALRNNVVTHTRTLTGAATTNLCPCWQGFLTAGQSVDIDMRFGMPQIEQSPYPTSPILPPVGTPAVTSRAADLLNLDPSLVDLNRSSIAMRFRLERGGVNVAGAGSQRILTLSDAPRSNTIEIEANATDANPRIVSRQAGGALVPQASLVGSGAFQSVAVAWGDLTTTGSWDGRVPGTAANSPIGPATTAQIAANGFDATPANITLQYLRIWRGRRLSAAQVQQQSSRTA